MAKRPKALERVSNRVILIGSVVGALAVIIGGLTAVGIDWPLTKNSPVIKQVKMDIDLHDMRIDTAGAKIRALEMDSLTRAMESDEFVKSQYTGRPDLTAGDRQQIARLERKIKNAQARWDKLLESE